MSNIFNKNLKIIKMSQIKRNPEQPRKYFNSEALEELKQSIIEHGVINPISVRKVDNHYQIIAGERRFRAGCLAGIKEIPCVVLNSNEQKCALIALVENIQRCDLDFVEEALAYKNIIDNFSLKQEVFALNIGKTQSSVANKLRILKLDSDLLQKMREHFLTERHARALLKVPSINRLEVLDYIINNNLTVAKSEEFIELFLAEKSEKDTKQPKNRPIRMIRDVRLFVNSINKSIKIMQDSGVDAKVSKDENTDFMTYTIVIPLKK